MDKNVVDEILNELLPAVEAIEAQSEAVLMFLKENGVATEDRLQPYLSRAANASNVRWRAIRVRMERLLSAAAKEEGPRQETKETSPQQSVAEASATEKNPKSEYGNDTQAPAPKEKQDKPVKVDRKEAA